MDRLLVLTPTRSPETGWGRYSEAVVTRLQERYHLDVMTELPDVVDLRSSPRVLVDGVRRVRRRTSAVDGVFSLVSYPYSLVAYLATRGTGVPYFVTCHGTYAVEPLHTKHRIPAQRSFSKAAAIFAVSSFTADKMRERQRGCNVYIVPNGVAERPPNIEPFDLDHRVLLTIGAFKSRKGQRLSVEAFANVAEDLADVEYHLVGKREGDYAKRVQSRARDLGIEHRVHFEGMVSDEELERWYATADVFLLTPRYEQHHFEGFGLVYLEANRYGVPAIGTVGTGAEDAIAEGVSGLCVKNDKASVADAIERLFSDEEFHEQLMKGAQGWAESHTWLRSTEQMATIMDRRL